MGMVEFVSKVPGEQKDGSFYLTIKVPKPQVMRMKELLSIADHKNESFLRIRLETLTRMKSYPQLKMVFGMLRKIYYAVGCDQWGMSENKGMEKLLEAMLRIACKEFNYPYVPLGTELIPKALSLASSIEVDLLSATIQAFAGTHGIDVSKESPYDLGAGF